MAKDSMTPKEIMEMTRQLTEQCAAMPRRERSKSLEELQQSNSLVHSLVVHSLRRLHKLNEE